MLFFILFSILYTIIFITDLMPLYRKKQSKAFGVCIAIMTLGFIIQSCVVFNVRIPSIASVFINLYHYFFK